MTRQKVDSGRFVTVEARRKTVEGFAQQFFDEQLTRSPFCIPEKTGERYKKLSHSLNAIRKGLVCAQNHGNSSQNNRRLRPQDQSLKTIQALEADSVTPTTEAPTDTSISEATSLFSTWVSVRFDIPGNCIGPEDSNALPLADPEVTYHCLSAEAPCEDRGIIQVWNGQLDCSTLKLVPGSHKSRTNPERACQEIAGSIRSW